MPINYSSAPTQSHDIGATGVDMTWYPYNNLLRMHGSSSQGCCGHYAKNTWYQNTTGRTIMLGLGLYKNSGIHVKNACGGWGTQITLGGGDPSEEAQCPLIPHGACWCVCGDGIRTFSQLLDTGHPAKSGDIAGCSYPVP